MAEILRSAILPKKWYVRSADLSTSHVRPTGLSISSLDVRSRAAITKWKAIKQTNDPATGEPASLLEIKPLTGRTHQIRVHLASIDHSIVADHLYAAGRKPLLNFQRPALHAHTISVSIAGDVQIFIAPLPDDFHYAGVLQKTSIRNGRHLAN